MKHNWVVQYFYDNKWVDFSYKLTEKEAIADEKLLNPTYKTRIIKLD